MRIAIHQPNHLPWLGTFHKIYWADKFVYLDNVQYSKGDYANRVKISNGEAKWLSIPVSKHRLDTPINKIKISKDIDWVTAHLNKIQAGYKEAPFFDMYYPLISKWLSGCKNKEYLCKVNLFLLNRIILLLGINTEVFYASQLCANGKKSSLVINIVKQLKGTEYLSGEQASSYQTKEEFGDIELIYQPFYRYLGNNPYRNNFLNGLSIIDALFHIGIDETKKILSGFNEELSNRD